MFIPGISKNVRFCKKREGQIISLKHGMSAIFEYSSLTTNNYQPSTINHQPSTTNYAHQTMLFNFFPMKSRM